MFVYSEQYDIVNLFHICRCFLFCSFNAKDYCLFAKKKENYITAKVRFCFTILLMERMKLTDNIRIFVCMILKPHFLSMISRNRFKILKCCLKYYKNYVLTSIFGKLKISKYLAYDYRTICLSSFIFITAFQ